MDKILFDRNINLALSAAAGTGKTRTLALRFLDLYLKYQNLFSIYALTFTNKASQEMRERIVRYLDILCNPEELTESPGKNSADKEEKEIVKMFSSRFKNISGKARLRKHHLLSNFNDLNVSTIHSFLNSVLKTIPFQTNVLPDFKIIEETEKNILIDKVLDDLLNDAAHNNQLNVLINRVLDTKYTDIKNTIKTLFLSVLVRIPEIMEISNNFKTMEVEVDENFASFKISFLKLVNLFKNHPQYKNKNLKRKIEKIETLLKQKNREKLILEAMDLFQKEYFKKETALRPELKKISNLTTKQAKEYILSNNRKLLIDNLKLLFVVYDRFQNAKKDMNIVTFNDLETYTLKALSDNRVKEYLYFKSSSQIEHLLIDEFQDTSIIQWKILEPIAEEITSGDNHSFFYVGDPNQAIYRFRGGENRLFDLIPNRFPGKVQTEHLTENYRSKEKIINFINILFSSQPGHKPMKSMCRHGGWVRVEDLGEYKQKEGLEVVQARAVKIIKSLKRRGYDYADIALLVRRNETGARFSEVLEEAGIPTRSESKASLFYQRPVQDIVNILRWITNPSEDFYLSLVLLSPLFYFKENMLKNLGRAKKTNLWNFLISRHSNWPTVKKLRRILNISNSTGLYELISFIYSELKVTEKYNSPQPFLNLLEDAYKFENEKGTSISLFIEHLQKYSMAAELAGIETNAVQILTCHKAKGLEFPVVLIPETVWDMGGKENEQFVFKYSRDKHELKLEDIYYRKDPLLKLFKEEIFLEEKERIFQDELNNLYVAMTRAKEGLWIIGYKNMRLSNPEPVRHRIPSIKSWAGGNGGRFRARTWFDFMTKPIKDKMKAGIYGLGEIKKNEIPQKVYPAKLLKIHSQGKYKKIRNLLPAHSPSYLLLRDRRASVEVGGISDKVRMVFRWGEICHYALSKIKKIDKKSLDEIICFSIDSAQKRYAQSKKEGEEVTKRLNTLLKSVLTDKDLKFIFYTDGNTKVETEVPVYFKRNEAGILERIDRLLIRDNSVEIIDYKGGKICSRPDRLVLHKKYLKQMENYKIGISKIYPGKEIRCYFLWLDAPKGKRIEEIV